MSDNEIYLLIKYIKNVLWRVAKCLSYIEEAWCLKVNMRNFLEYIYENKISVNLQEINTWFWIYHKQEPVCVISTFKKRYIYSNLVRGLERPCGFQEVEVSRC